MRKIVSIFYQRVFRNVDDTNFVSLFYILSRTIFIWEINIKTLILTDSL